MENKLKDIFQNKLNNYQAPVDTSAWKAIQSGISSGAGASSGGFFATAGAKVIATILAAAVVIGATYIFIPKSDPVKNQINVIKTEETSPVVLEEAIEVAPEKILKKESPQEEEKMVASQKTTHVNKTNRIVEEKPKDNTKIEINTVSEVVTTEKPSKSPLTTAKKATKVTNPQPSSTDPLPISIEDIIETFEPVDFDIQPYEGDELSYQLIPSQGIDDDIEVLWDFGNGTTSKEIQPTITYEDQGEYEITLRFKNNKNNRVWEVARHAVKAYLPISWEIQNIFTPNDDLYNQYFDPAANAENLTIESVVVYDNHQKTVFTSTPSLKKWNGKLNDGRLATQGYYYYQVTAKGQDGEMHIKKGKVYLITGK